MRLQFRPVQFLPISARHAFAAALLLCLSAPASFAADTPRVREVIIAFKTHFDIGYTDMASNVVRRYRTTMIDQALKVVDQNRDLPPQQQFAWTIPGWPMTKIAEDWEGQTPERKQKILQAFKEGRFVVHALPFSLHTELLEPEDLVRGLGFASRICRQAGLPLPRDAKMTDVPCHTWFLPTLLRNAGVDFLHLGCNGGSSSPHVPPLFWWEGPDGSRLLTMYSASGYGTGLAPPADWPYKTWLALIHTGDNHGPPTPEEVKKLLDEAAVKLPNIKVRIGRLSDFADAILAEKPEIPVIRSDMPDSWIYGPMCDPAGARLARNIRPIIETTESLNTLLGSWGVKAPNAADILPKAYEQSLLYGEHTWGGALYWVAKYGQGIQWNYGDTWKKERAAGRFKRLEDSWAEHTSYIENARGLVAPMLEKELNGLAQAVAVEGRRFVVFNPLPWKRDGVVSASCPDNKILALKPVDGRDVVQASSNIPGLVRFIAREIPPLGYRTYLPVAGRALAKDPSTPLVANTNTASIENEFFTVVLDPARGCIRSLIEKKSGRELADSIDGRGFGQYLYERFDSNQTAQFVNAYAKHKSDWVMAEFGKANMPPATEVPYSAASPENCELQFEQYPNSLTAILSAKKSVKIAHAVTTRVTLYPNQPYLDLEITLHDKAADPWPEAGWLCLPFKIDSPQFRLGRVGSVVDPTRDLARGANRHLFGINTGVSLFDAQGRGVGLCALDNPLVSFDQPGCWKYSLDFVPRKPVVYVNLFNNQWTTNFRMWNQGTWTARVRIWAFDQYDAESTLITPSLEARYPLQAAAADGKAGSLAFLQTGLEVSKPGTLVTALGPNPDGPGTLLRLWEYAGKSGDCLVRLPEALKAKTVQPIDLRGTPVAAPMPVKQNSFIFASRAFAPASFLIRK